MSSLPASQVQQPRKQPTPIRRAAATRAAHPCPRSSSHTQTTSSEEQQFLFSGSANLCLYLHHSLRPQSLRVFAPAVGTSPACTLLAPSTGPDHSVLSAGMSGSYQLQSPLRASPPPPAPRGVGSGSHRSHPLLAPSQRQSRHSHLLLVPSTGTESNVCGSKHCQEEIHGLMEAALRFDDGQDQRIPKQSNDVHGTERDANPELNRLQARDPHQCQHRGHEDCAIKLKHDGLELAALELLIQEVDYLWLSIPFSSIYAMIFLGNCLVLHVIRTEPSLHEPMFYFLAMLALTDLCMGVSTMYTVVGILWGFIQEISLDACIAQSYFIHGAQCMNPCTLKGTVGHKAGSGH
ncbi:hypothetical protein QTO34_003832 [Cnephaeus nilssonii]|uniref:G-protein coupled receptors family 1 profile domain-containing protein n=1 Tax=Cnephaeus nilssonii TaxID=3371016 RepID=A0AA40LKZ2_CNENI|nr:hypothetical protein QTO34_003832 [Eptesicus nilssonii]